MGLHMQEIGKFFNRFTPVTELVLLFSGHFGKGPFITVWMNTGS